MEKLGVSETEKIGRKEGNLNWKDLVGVEVTCVLTEEGEGGCSQQSSCKKAGLYNIFGSGEGL